MRWNLDPRSCLAGVAVGAGVTALVGGLGRPDNAVGQSAAPMAAGPGPRYELKVWATSSHGSTTHGAYVMDVQTGEVKPIANSSSDGPIIPFRK